MDLSSNASPRSLPTPQSPAPLALSEFMAQATPCSDTTNPPSDKPELSQDISSPVRAVAEPKPASVREEPRTVTPQRPPAPEEAQIQETRPPPTRDDTTPPPTDWLATRQQLLPRRNQGKKADWIRGWSQAVSSYGEETYCACSETIEHHGANRGRKAKTSAQLADNVRAILQRTASPSSTKSKPTTPEPEVCRLCSRPPSTTAGNGSSGWGGSTGLLHSPGTGRGLLPGKRFFSELLLRVRRPSSSSSPRSKSAAAAATAAASHKRDAEIRNLAAWPEDCQPRWATTSGPRQKRFLVRPPSQPVSAPVQGTGAGTGTGPAAAAAAAQRLKSSPAPGGETAAAAGYFVWKSRARGRLLPTLAGTNGGGGAAGSGAGLGAASSSSSDLGGTSDSDVDAHRPGLSRSFSRLQRAAALLQRATARSKD
ncbi:uncharacterized protein B0H64DRAFT_448510 [Chaetomium fimeti]|uniref:Uncharacterized protein n=1 Tax=Chaetomium fimeti TaxID=1854472 RepID=A0AAE0HPG3_9PEZI|nr:hypothetical protein B0H64DRAFT_448510 [Chaetomium fimeti]